MNAFESTQGITGTFLITRTSQINLNHLFSITLSDITYRNSQYYIFTFGDCILAQFSFSISKVSITQPVTEWKKWLLLHISIGTPLHGIVFKVRQLIHILIESDRQASTGIILSPKSINDSCTTRLSRIPCLQNRFTSSRFGH